MEHVFSYGTLQNENVQIANFGRKLFGKADILEGYVVDNIKITDERVIRESGTAIHPILKQTGNTNDTVAGTVFELSDTELAQADDYEVSSYHRVSATLKSGITCWIYCAAATL